ncbi:MAG: TonB-dependent receptor [Gammaproteobacteria bacterium]|nr:TonB-dependent receptor [Gammaproteobacteria bacterium]MDH4315835.1 TonB-dependent receptor [Gammaproteobacteria bacterium]
MTGAISAGHAQTIEEITVTATRRSESVQDVPLAITALTGDFTREVNLDDVKDLVTFTPGVTGNSQDSFIDAISVRGIRTQDFGVGGDPSAAFFKNELYEGRNGSAVTSLYDVDRAEILRGPQGFLFGRNSIGGAFSVHTKKADVGGDLSGYVDLDVAERGHVVGEGAVNVPVSDSFAMRFAGYVSQEDGFVRNFSTNTDLIEHEKAAIRWSTRYENDKMSLDTTVEYEDRKQSGSVYRAIETGDIWDSLETALGPITIRGGERDTDSDQSGGDNDDASILTLGVRLDYDFDFATLTSLTGYKDHDYYYNEDYDGTPLSINNYRQDQTGDYIQQEFRLVSNDDGPLSWYAGVSFYQEEIDARFTFIGQEDYFCQYYGYYYNGLTFTGCADLYAYYGSPFTPSADGNLTETGRIQGKYTGWSGYVDVNYALNDRWDVGLGLRYTDDEKDFAINVPTPNSDLGAYWAYTFSTAGEISDTQSWDDVQMRFMLRFQPTDTALLYASYTEGFKSGGFGSFALVDANGNGIGGGVTDVTQASGARPNTFNPEVADSYEIGYKDTLLDGRMIFGLNAFYYDYKDLQVVVFDGGAASVQNVGKVESKGLEGSLTTALGEQFDLFLALSWLDSEATELQSICGLPNPNGCEGSSLFWAPEFSGAAVLNGYFDVGQGEIKASLDVTWESERGGGWEGLQSTMIPSYTEMSFRVDYKSPANWGIGAYVENLNDEFTYDGLNNNGGIVPSHFFGHRRPRTAGMRFTYEWE